MQMIPPFWFETGIIGTLRIERKGPVWPTNIVQALAKGMVRQQVEKALSQPVSISKTA
jgi:hypothetical protein